MTDKPTESAEEIVNLIISNTASQYSEEWKPDIVYTKEELIEIVQSFQDQCVREACEKQRKLCADNAKVKMKLYRTPIGGGTKPIVCRDSIINTPEPT